MSREGQYLVFATEQYRHAKGLSGPAVIDLFREYGIAKFITDTFEMLHIESVENMVSAIDDYIATCRVKQ